jgi:hypothetical protein
VSRLQEGVWNCFESAWDLFHVGKSEPGHGFGGKQALPTAGTVAEQKAETFVVRRTGLMEFWKL